MGKNTIFTFGEVEIAEQTEIYGNAILKEININVL